MSSIINSQHTDDQAVVDQVEQAIILPISSNPTRQKRDTAATTTSNNNNNNNTTAANNNTTPDTSEDSPPEDDLLNYVGSHHGRKVAGERLRRRRRRCVTVASFFPFLAASIALGAFVWVGRDSSNDASVDESGGGGSVNEAVEGSMGATISDGVEEEFGGAAGVVVTTGTASPTVSETTATTAPSKEAIVEIISIPTVSKGSNDHDDNGVSLTSATATASPTAYGSTAAPATTTTTTSTPTSGPTSNQNLPVFSTSDAEESQHGNLRTTSSPSASPTNTNEPTNNGPTTAPTTSSNGPTSSPTTTNGPTVAELTDIGNNDFDSGDFPLGECEGDCDADDDCEGSLLCFRRDGDESVPGCSGEGATGTDYCFDRPSNYLFSRTDETTTVLLGLCEGDCDNDAHCEGSLTCFQRGGPESVPGCTGTGTAATDYCFDRPLNYLWTSAAFPLGLCEGDCDDDSDCDGNLICEQRDGLDEIVGCVGLGVKDGDYCVYNPDDAILDNMGAGSSNSNQSEVVISDTEGDATTLDPEMEDAPVIPGVASCVADGETCPKDQKTCCSEYCLKDQSSGEQVCAPASEGSPQWLEDLLSNSEVHGNLRATISPTTSPTAAPTCVATGQTCPADKKLCCDGVCAKNKDTGEKVCGAWITPPTEDNESSLALSDTGTATCVVSGQPCPSDKKMCCSNKCMKNKDAEKVAGNDKQEVCE